MGLENDQNPSYSQFACIGTGFSAIGLGATLKRWYGITDIHFFERDGQLGGTWNMNTYPGCACDVPSALYSFSFESNPNWSRVLPSRDELWAYLKKVADKYSLTSKMAFGASVERCQWVEETKRWRLSIRRSETDTVFVHEAQFLFSGSGQLVQPREIDVPGVETFTGPIFHSSRWRNDVDLTGKKVVIIGNGCTAAQIVPSIVKKTKHLTQIVRSKHWILPAIDAKSAKKMQLLLKYVPGALVLQRFIVFCVTENSWRGFYMTDAAAKFRQGRRKQAETYMRSAAPEKYHDLLIPDFEIGCKRRIFDSGYLSSLHAENLTLTDARILEIVPGGVRTTEGVVEADVIVLANGFATNRFLGDVDVIGRGGETIAEHWDTFGGAEAYNNTVLNGFPNFFMLLGPNTATGHTSTVMAVENSVNYSLRVIKPVLDGEASAVEPKREAEMHYAEQIQRDLLKTVWSSGCHSWYVKDDAKDGKQWNAMTYPYSQTYFWYRCLFPVWGDWNLIGPATRKSRPSARKGLSLAFIFVVAGALVWGKRTQWSVEKLLQASRQALAKWVR